MFCRVGLYVSVSLAFFHGERVLIYCLFVGGWSALHRKRRPMRHRLYRDYSPALAAAEQWLSSSGSPYRGSHYASIGQAGMTPRNLTSIIATYPLTAVLSLDVCPAKLASDLATLMTSELSTLFTVEHSSSASSLPTWTPGHPASQTLIRRNGLKTA